jgi:two-component system C4-dicarboxylate transport sensor histidine kinase DctB
MLKRVFVIFIFTFSLFASTIDENKTSITKSNLDIKSNYEILDKNKNCYKNYYNILGQILMIFFVILIIIIFFLLREKKLKQEIEKINKNLEDRIKKEVLESRKKDKQLQQQARLAQMGQMISMIAHQWRQPLGAISSTIISIQVKLQTGKFDFDNLKDREGLVDFLYKNTEDINNYIHFLSNTIDDFRNLFKPNRSIELVKIQEPVNKALSVIKEELKSKDIDIILDFKIDCNSHMFTNEIMQVVLNILKNSEDNFLEKNIKSPKIKIEIFDENDYNIIAISDNGGGIKDTIIDKIFDPYFSTKDEKNGTGLGLYMSKIIVEEHNHGKFEVKNIENGVCFYIKLEKRDFNG